MFLNDHVDRVICALGASTLPIPDDGITSANSVTRLYCIVCFSGRGDRLLCVLGPVPHPAADDHLHTA